MSQIRFLNIDLDIESKIDVSPIVQEFSDRLNVMRNEQKEGVYIASFETGYVEENEIIEEYVSLIESLSPEVKEIWDKCTKREFDFGYDSGRAPSDFHSKISEKSIKSLAKVGGSITVTIYPPYENGNT